MSVEFNILSTSLCLGNWLIMGIRIITVIWINRDIRVINIFNGSRIINISRRIRIIRLLGVIKVP